jgi:hypothetical protein
MLHSPHTISLPLERDTHITEDGITVIPNIDNNRLRGSNAMALTLHTICRPISDQKPVYRDDCLSLSKLAEEGMLSESAIVLGWKINTRSLLLSLPPDKFNSWSLDIKGILANKKATQEELEMLIGRLNHAAGALPIARYFLNRIRHAASTSFGASITNTPKKKIKWLPKPTLQDLHLFHNVFLPKIHSGININLLTYRRPFHILFSDACPQGIGGYSTVTGKAWRWKIPVSFSDSVHSKNIFLEFLAAVITI